MVNQMTKRIVTLDGMTLNTLDVFDVAYENAIVEIAPEAMINVQTARDVVERIVDGDETVYGINTGFGSLVHSRIQQEDVEQLQLNLIRSCYWSWPEPCEGICTVNDVCTDQFVD